MSVVSARVAGCRQVGPATHLLSVVPPAELSWSTGECLGLGLPAGKEPLFRAYSIASPGGSELLEFFIAAVPGGALSPRLCALKEGDEVLVTCPPFGTLRESRLAPCGRILWMLASGTGAAPFLAFLRTPEVLGKYERVILAHSVHSPEETEFVREAASRVPGVLYLPSVTRADGPGLHAHLQDALRGGSLEEAAGARLTVEDGRVLLCGNPQMVEAVQEVLKERGFVTPRRTRPGQMLAEFF